MTDDQLMEMVRDKNLRQAYDVLVLRHYREAVRFCMKMLGMNSPLLILYRTALPISMYRENGSPYPVHSGHICLP